MCRSLHSALRNRKKCNFYRRQNAIIPRCIRQKKLHNFSIFLKSTKYVQNWEIFLFFFCICRSGSSSKSNSILLSLNGDFVYTWNTVNMDCMKESKWLLDSLPDPALASVNFPPKICIPNKEKMKMKRNRITSKEFMDAMEFTSDFTKLPIEDQ